MQNPAQARSPPQYRTRGPPPPVVIAESVVREAAVWLDEDLPDEWAEWLAARAARVYASSAHFRTFGSSLRRTSSFASRCALASNT